MNKQDEITDEACLQLGRSMLTFGLKYAINLLQTQTEILDRQLAALAPAPVKVAIRPAMKRTMALVEEAPTVREAKEKEQLSGQKLYWAQFTPEERKKEQRRRQKVAAKRRAAA